jgi:nucleotide-binding universal stress UspA family protein
MILAPVDFSSATERVVEVAAELARAVNGYVVLLHVLTTSSVLTGAGAANLGSIRTAVEHLHRLKAKLRADAMPVQAVWFVGDPAPDITTQAAKLRAAFIVLGSHGHSALYHFMLGGTASAVMKQSRCPVVIVPAAGRGNATPSHTQTAEVAALR